MPGLWNPCESILREKASSFPGNTKVASIDWSINQSINQRQSITLLSLYRLFTQLACGRLFLNLHSRVGRPRLSCKWNDHFFRPKCLSMWSIHPSTLWPIGLGLVTAGSKHPGIISVTDLLEGGSPWYRKHRIGLTASHRQQSDKKGFFQFRHFFHKSRHISTMPEIYHAWRAQRSRSNHIMSFSSSPSFGWDLD